MKQQKPIQQPITEIYNTPNLKRYDEAMRLTTIDDLVASIILEEVTATQKPGTEE